MNNLQLKKLKNNNNQLSSPNKPVADESYTQNQYKATYHCCQNDDQPCCTEARVLSYNFFKKKKHTQIKFIKYHIVLTNLEMKTLLKSKYHNIFSLKNKCLGNDTDNQLYQHNALVSQEVW